MFRFVFVFMLSLKLRPFVQSFFDMQATRQPHVFLPFLLLFFRGVAFSRVFLYHCRFFFVWRREHVVRFSLPDGVFLSLTTGRLDFFSSVYVRIQSNQSIVLRSNPFGVCMYVCMVITVGEGLGLGTAEVVQHRRDIRRVLLYYCLVPQDRVFEHLMYSYWYCTPIIYYQSACECQVFILYCCLWSAVSASCAKRREKKVIACKLSCRLDLQVRLSLLVVLSTIQ